MRNVFRSLLFPLMLAVAIPAQAQSFQDEVRVDLEAQKSKWVGLFDAMPDEAMNWRPGEGVRSVSEVFMHISLANLMLPTNLMQVSLPDGMRPEWQTEGEGLSDRASIRMALELGFDHLIALTGEISDAELEEPTNVFGRDSNVRGAMMLLQTHNHEHLGQAIAYARTNDVTPPWSR